ncbi:long-chain fatty acid--CoA ligase [Pseudonocardia ailaonensis]|uniref:Long-chain fatty acid--CoA ligase n=1 Tax=Pseudonocardia ailaonensis TaxID=367279 RepID=A0ABN2NDB2_9PSEU
MTSARTRPAPLRGQTFSGTRIGEWIDVTAHHDPTGTCFVTPAGRSTFAEVRDRVRLVAGGLQALGVRRGDRVALLATDSVEYVEALLALLKIGAVAVPLNFRLSRPEIRTLLEAAQATTILVGDRYVADVQAVRPELEYLDTLIGLEDSPGTLPYSEVRSTTLEEVRVDDEDIVAVAFTSGTTGLPKGVMQSHRMWKTMCTNAVLEYRFLRGEFRYSASPLYHVAGFALVLKAIARGSASLLLPQWDPAALLPWFRAGLTDVFLVPTMINALVRQPGVSKEDFASLRSVFYGAAPMTPALLLRAMELMDCDFYNGFGAGTEAGMQSVLTPEDHLRALDGAPHLLESVGRPGWNIDIQIWDDRCQELPVGEVGEIVSRSDMVMSGYLGSPEKTAEVVVNGWFRGGDLGRFDEEGYLYLAGRKNDMIIRGGENVYPVEIETVLAEFPGLVECAVVGVPDEFWGESVRAHVVLAENTAAGPAELTAFCAERMARYKVPTEFRLHGGALPKNASGKILRRLLRGDGT